MDKTVLILGCGVDQVPMIERAKALGLKVIGLDGNPEAKGFELCDHHEAGNIKDEDWVEQTAKKWNKKLGIDGVIAPAVEVGKSVGRVVDKLGLRGIGEKTGWVLTDKVLRCAQLEKAKIPQPNWDTNLQWPQAGKTWDTFPCVVKPRDKSAAVGVKFIKNKEQLEKESYDLVQEYIEGWELSVEVLVLETQRYIHKVADRNYDKKFRPYMVEDGCQLPSKINERVKAKIHTLILKLIDVFDLRACAIKLDLVVKDNIVYVLEVAPRLGGGKLSSVMIPMQSGVDWWLAALKLCMGFLVTYEDLIPTKKTFVAQRYRIKENPKSNRDRDGSVEAEGGSYEEAVKKAEEEIKGENVSIGT